MQMAYIVCETDTLSDGMYVVVPQIDADHAKYRGDAFPTRVFVGPDAAERAHQYRDTLSIDAAVYPVPLG